MSILSFPNTSFAPRATLQGKPTRFSGVGNPKNVGTKTRFEQLKQDIQYKNWNLHIGQDGERLFLQVRFPAIDANTGLEEEQKGRKWFLSPHMTNSEFVQTAFKAILTAEEHETRENFRYKGQAVFSPHYDIDALVELCQKRKFDVRG